MAVDIGGGHFLAIAYTGYVLDVPVERFLGEVDHYVLYLSVLVVSWQAVLPADAAHLESAPRGCWTDPVVVVDPDNPNIELVRNAVSPADVVGPNCTGEAVFCTVREVHGLLLRVERQYADDRAEDLLLRHAHLVLDIGKDCWGIIVAFIVGRIGNPVASGGDSSALFLTDLDVVFDAL